MSYRHLLRLAAIILSISGAGTLHAEFLVGRIVGVTDGDTLTLFDSGNLQHKIRLAGIDAPERIQDFGEKSKLNLSNLAYNQNATAACPKRDRYRRDVCVVTVAGKDVGLEQVRAGMAWWYRAYSAEQTPEQRSAYEQAEFMAKVHRLGLLSGRNPIPPWEWRRSPLAK